MVKLLKDGMYNANKIAEMLLLDYKTVQHHLKVLRENNVIKSDSDGYGAEYKLTDYFMANFSVFVEIWSKLEAGEKVFKPR